MLHYDAPAAAQLSNVATNSAQFELKGGVYVLSGVFTGTSVELQKLGPDGTTFLSFGTPVKLTATGVFGPAYVPPGQYKLIVTSATAVYTELSRVPTE